jgi:hypothetical protein
VKETLSPAPLAALHGEAVPELRDLGRRHPNARLWFLWHPAADISPDNGPCAWRALHGLDGRPARLTWRNDSTRFRTVGSYSTFPPCVGIEHDLAVALETDDGNDMDDAARGWAAIAGMLLRHGWGALAERVVQSDDLPDWAAPTGLGRVPQQAPHQRDNPLAAPMGLLRCALSTRWRPALSPVVYMFHGTRRDLIDPIGTPPHEDRLRAMLADGASAPFLIGVDRVFGGLRFVLDSLAQDAGVGGEAADATEDASDGGPDPDWVPASELPKVVRPRARQSANNAAPGQRKPVRRIQSPDGGWLYSQTDCRRHWPGDFK